MQNFANILIHLILTIITSPILQMRKMSKDEEYEEDEQNC